MNLIESDVKRRKVLHGWKGIQRRRGQVFDVFFVLRPFRSVLFSSFGSLIEMVESFKQNKEMIPFGGLANYSTLFWSSS